MRIAVASDTPEGLDARVSYVFGRAPYIVIVDLVDEEVKDVKIENNPYAQSPGGAGPALAQYLIDKGVEVVIAGDVGPNAAMTLSGAGITVIPVMTGMTVREAINYSKGQMIQPPLPYIAPRFPLSREDELRWLKQRKEWIEKRLQEIEERLKTF